MIKLEKIILSKFFWPISFVLHLSILITLYFKFGINFSNESDRYISVARELNSENLSASLEYLWPYSTYILFLTFGIKLNLSLYIILFIQYLFCLSGFYFFYKFILSQEFFSKIYARVCILLVMICPLIVYWLLTFYTESFFISLIIISTYLVFKDKTKQNLFFISLVLLLLLFCRPVGVFYVIAFSFILMKSRDFKHAFLFLWCAFILVFVAVVFFVPLHYRDFTLPILQGSIICGFPNYPGNILPEGDYTLIEVYSAFLKQNSFADLFILFVKKGASFFTLTRPYYSLSHNLINCLHYVFFLGIFYSCFTFFRRKESNVFNICFLYILMSSLLIVILIYNEWSERFIVPLFPFFILMSLIAVSKRNRRLGA